MSTTVKVILGVVVAGILGVVALILFVFGLTSGVATAGDEFLTKLKTKDYGGAVSMCAPALQTELGGAEGLQQMIETPNLTPTDWSYSSRSINNGDGSLGGTVTCADGKTHDLSLVLASENDKWKITGLHISP